MEKLRVFESFSGIGCQSMALRNLGIDFEVVGISEVDKWALLAYDVIHNEPYDIEIPSKEEMLKEFNDKHIAYNFSTNKSEMPRKIEDIEKLYKAHIRCKNYGDIRLINPSELPKMDLFTYSYPCKNISIAGKGAGLEKDSGTQSSLVWDCFKIIEYHKPKYLLMENVKNLVGKKHKPQFDLICEELEKIGYNNYWKVLDGKDFGVPQQRERVMMISIRKDIDDNTFEMPKGYPLTKTVRDILQDDVDDYLYKNKKYEFVNQKRVVAKFIDGNFDQAKRIYKIDSYSPTICVKYDTLNILLDDGKVRILSPLECWRLMGIKDEDFYKVESLGFPKGKLYERAGRGIVIPMLEEIFRNLFLNK